MFNFIITKIGKSMLPVLH